MQVQPYLFFEGRCEEAVKFYQSALGAKVEGMMRYKESPESMPAGKLPPGSGDKIMHAAFNVGTTTVMASDGMCSGKPQFSGVSLTLNVKDEAEADRMFNGLAAGGEVQMPLQKTFYSPRFGMVRDKFGLGWMVIVPQAMPPKS